MRHRKAGRKLGRESSHRQAMFRNLVTSVLEHERVMTTDAKAKEIRRWVDWMITLGKRGDLAARRQALQIIKDKSVVYKLFSVLAPRFQNLNGGYTRVVKIGCRRGDGAPMSIIELAEHTEKKVKGPKKKKIEEKMKEAPTPEQAIEEEKEDQETGEELTAEYSSGEELPENNKETTEAGSTTSHEELKGEKVEELSATSEEEQESD